MTAKGLLTLLTFLAAIIGSHWLMGYSMGRFFELDESFVTGVLLPVLMSLSVSFPLAMALAWLHSNAVTRILYFVTSCWIGFFFPFLLATGLAWLGYGLSSLLGFSVDMDMVFGGLLGFVLAVSLVGIWNAFRVQITRFDVPIANLPPSWEGKKIAHLSDLHVGPIRRAGFLRQVARKVASLEPEVVLITGDLFDGACRNPSVFSNDIDKIRGKRGVFFATGNHEHYLGIKRALGALEETQIRVLDDEHVDLDGLQIVGGSYPVYKGNDHRRSPFDGDGYDPQKPTVLLYHTPTSIETSHDDLGAQQLSTYLAPDTNFSVQRNNGVDLQLSGHTHAGQISPFGWVTRQLFNGYDSGLHTVDGFTIFISAGTGTWGPPIRTVGKCEIALITLSRGQVKR